MTVIALERPAAPRTAWLVVALGLLIAALVAVALFIGRPPAPPANGQIVFGRFNDALGDTEIFVTNPDGSHVRQLLPGTFEGPNWSPDGTRIAIGHATVKVDGTGYHEWNQSGNLFHIECWDWSPDGQRMLCEGFADGAERDAEIHGVYTVRASDGKDLVRLSAPGDGGVPGVYSPDGAMVAYVGTFNGTRGALILVRTDGSERHRLGQLSQVGDPRWAPDGKSILVNGNGREYSVDVATGLATPLRIKSRSDTNILGAEWSPDGTRLLVRLFVDEHIDLYTMAPDGTDPAAVTNDSFDERFFDWGTHPIEQ